MALLSGSEVLMKLPAMVGNFINGAGGRYVSYRTVDVS
jgi:hypothetical protein